METGHKSGSIQTEESSPAMAGGTQRAFEEGFRRGSDLREPKCVATAKLREGGSQIQQAALRRSLDEFEVEICVALGCANGSGSPHDGCWLIVRFRLGILLESCLRFSMESSP